MFRRHFLQLSSVAASAATSELPQYRVRSSHAAAGNPNRFPGRVIGAAMEGNPASVRQAVSAAMTQLTGAKDPRDAWRSFFSPDDVVGIKVNCSGSPKILSHPLVVGEIARALVEVGVPAKNIIVFERFADQLATANYTPYLPEGAEIHAMETGDRRRFNLKNYDTSVYVETDFFGEEQTRSFLSRLVTERLTKIVNVPNMKDHAAAGVTGCLKNIAYGSFSNVARSHQNTKTNTLSFIGTLYNVEPLRSKTVLHLMDGIKGVWQGGPFVRRDEWLFEPKRLMAGTDPVAMDRLLIDVIEAKRREMGSVSVFDRSGEALKASPFYREPGHIEYAGRMGLGVFEKSDIRLEEVRA